MKPVIYKYGEFDHRYEEFMFDELLLVLSKVDTQMFPFASWLMSIGMKQG